MADTKISALTAASALGGTELLPGVQGGADKKITAQQVADYALANGVAPGSDTQVLFNDGGLVKGDSNLYFRKSSGYFEVGPDGTGCASGVTGDFYCSTLTFQTPGVTLQGPASGGGYTLSFPVDAGTNGYFLKTDGSGVTSWADAGGSSFNAAISNIAETNPSYETSPDYNDRHYERMAITWSDPSMSNPGFTDQNTSEKSTIVTAGRYAYGDHNQNKLTVIGRSEYLQRIGACQGFLEDMLVDSYAMGDSSLGQQRHYFAGGSCNGDEGQALRLVSHLSQQPSLVLANISSVPSQPAQSNSTTLSGAVTASRTSQTFDVVDASWISVNDWICLEPDIPDSANQLEAVKVTAKSGNTLTAVVLFNHNNSGVVKPCKVLSLDNVGGMGELRVLVNRSGTAYSTGTVSAVSGGGVDFSGTSLADNIVGGNTTNIGAISFDQDTYTGVPFSGSDGTTSGPLRSWYQITAVTTTTHLAVFKTSAAGDGALDTFASSGGTFVIKPAMRILKIVSNSVICEPSAHTWTAADVVECVICPYPDVSGFNYMASVYAKGFADDRPFFNVMNGGSRRLGVGYSVGRYGSGPAGKDADAWLTGFSADQCATGLSISSSSLGAIAIATSSDVGSQIEWNYGGSGAAAIELSAANGNGMDIKSCNSDAILRTVNYGVSTVDTNLHQLSWVGYFQICRDGGGHAPYIRLGGSQTLNSSIDGTVDIRYRYFGEITQGGTGPGFDFIFNDITDSKTIYMLGLDSGGVHIPPLDTATSNTTNQKSNELGLRASVWDGSAAQSRRSYIQMVPGSGVDNAPVAMEFHLWDNVNNNAGFLNLPLRITTAGLLSFGAWNDGYGPGNGYHVQLDATNMTANRLFKFPDNAGDILVASSNTTGSGSALLAANCPAITATAPYTWLTMISHDGSTVYVPAWK